MNSRSTPLSNRNTDVWASASHSLGCSTGGRLTSPAITLSSCKHKKSARLLQAIRRASGKSCCSNLGWQFNQTNVEYIKPTEIWVNCAFFYYLRKAKYLIKRYLDTKQAILRLLSVRTGKTGGRKKKWLGNYKKVFVFHIIGMLTTIFKHWMNCNWANRSPEIS